MSMFHKVPLICNVITKKYFKNKLSVESTPE